jgi:hypothetical protein
VRRALRAAAVTAVAAALATVAPAPSLARPSAAAQASLLTLLDRTAWVGNGFDFQLTLRTAAAPAGSQLRMTVHDEVRSRSEFERSLQGLGLRQEVFPLPSVPVEEADGDGDGTITLVVPLVARDGVEPVSLDDPGVYPVEVELLDADDDVLGSLITHLVRLPSAGDDADAVPLAVTVVVPLHAPPTDLDAGTAGPSGAPIIDTLGAVAAAMAAHPEIEVALATTPEAIAEAAATDPDLVDDLRAAIDSSGSEVLGAPWVQLDEAAWQRADAESLGAQLARGNESTEGTLGTPASSTRRLRPGRSGPSASAMVEHGGRVLIVDEADLDPLDATQFPYTVARPFELALADPPVPGDAATVPALGADATLAALAAEVDADPILAASHILADLAVIGADEPESARVATLVLPEAAVASAPFLDALLAGLEPPPAPFLPEPAATPVLVPSTPTDAIAAVEPVRSGDGGDDGDVVVRTFAVTEDPDDVSDIARQLAEEEDDLASYRSVFGPDDPIAARVDTVLANAAAEELDDVERGAALASTRAVRDVTLGGIEGPEQQTVRLTDREGQIQLVLTNASGAPADIDLVLRGDRLVFPDAPGGLMPVRLEEFQTRIDLRVEARSSGDAPLQIGLTSPDGRLVLDETRITVRATAISGVGIALMAAAAVFLAAWWTRTVVRERRAKRKGHHAHARTAT